MKFAKVAAPESQGNIAPLLDVVLLLLIFFMVTTSFAERQIPLNLPESEATATQEAESLVINIDSKGTYSVDKEVISEEDLALLFQTIARQERNLEIRADEAARHGDVVRVLDLAKKFELSKIGIVVDGEH